MAPAGCQNQDAQVMNNIHNRLYQITIIPYKTKLDVLPPSKPLLALVKLGLRKTPNFDTITNIMEHNIYMFDAFMVDNILTRSYGWFVVYHQFKCCR